MLGVGRRKHAKKPKKHNQTLIAAENALAAAQTSLKAEALQQQLIIEKNLILAELLYCAERLQVIYNKHLGWLELAGASGSSGLVSSSCGSSGTTTMDRLQEQGPSSMQEQPDLLDDSHWVIYLLETATWQQLQHALSMTCTDWVEYHRQYCSDLMRLLEVSKRCPEVQDIMLEGKSVPQQLPQAMPAAAAAFASSSSSVVNSSVSGVSEAVHSGPALDMILHMLKDTGVLAYVALLHGMPAIFDAASKNVLTGEECAAPPTHWANVARRMRLSRQQKLHFKLALQNFARQARAAAAQGLSVLQETPSYAFLLACQDIAMRQLSSSEDDSPSTTAGLEASAPQCPVVAAAAAAAAAAVAAKDPRHSSGVSAQSHAADGSAGEMGPAYGCATAADGSAAPGSAGPGGACAAGEGPAAAAGASVSAGGSTSKRQQQQQQQQPPCQEEQAVMDVDEPHSPTKKLQRQIGLYYRQVVGLNMFLADTLTLEQALMLNIASYPFFPQLAAVAEAAIQLPDEPQPEQGQEGVGLLMTKRRSFMQRAHLEWWNDYGQPGAAQLFE